MESNISSSLHLAPSKSVATLIRTVSDLANTTQQTVLQNMTVTNGNVKEHGTINSRRHFLHLVSMFRFYVLYSALYNENQL